GRAAADGGATGGAARGSDVARASQPVFAPAHDSGSSQSDPAARSPYTAGTTSSGAVVHAQHSPPGTASSSDRSSFSDRYSSDTPSVSDTKGFHGSAGADAPAVQTGAKTMHVPGTGTVTYHNATGADSVGSGSYNGTNPIRAHLTGGDSSSAGFGQQTDGHDAGQSPQQTGGPAGNGAQPSSPQHGTGAASPTASSRPAAAEARPPSESSSAFD